jgi:hypothetical protein
MILELCPSAVILIVADDIIHKFTIFFSINLGIGVIGRTFFSVATSNQSENKSSY